MKAASILITGASGFIGSYLSQILSESFPSVSIVGTGRKKNTSLVKEYPNFEYIQCDLLDKSSIRKQLPNRVDILIHLAGDRRTFVELGEFSAQTISNTVMTSYIADYAYSAKTNLFLYASSVYIYSGNDVPPFRESAFGLPCENLGATKLASESLLNARAVSGHFKALSFRIGTVYGPGASSEQFISQAIKKLTSSDQVACFGAGHIKRDFIFIDDVVCAFNEGVKSFGRNFTYDAFNIGTGIGTSIKDVVYLLADLICTNKKIEFSQQSYGRTDADKDHQLDLTRARSVLGWQPKISLREGLSRTIDSLDYKNEIYK